jgi:hypothetical protein
VSCPTTGIVGVALTCSASVTDTEAGTASTPAGTLDWSADHAGSFSASSCTLSGADGTSGCAVAFTPATSGTIRLTASYPGSDVHVPSSGSDAVEVASTTGLDTTPPAVAITWPLDGAGVRAGSKVKIQATATDAGGIRDVRFFVAGTLRCTDSAAPYACGWRTASLAGYMIQIQAVARDLAGNQTTDSITVHTV